MRETPTYNDKNSRSSNHMWHVWDMFDLSPTYWPCPLVAVPAKNRADLGTVFKIRTPDSRSGLKGLTISRRMGKL